MTDFDSIIYYERRAQHARALAVVAATSGIAAIHLDLASRYAAIVDQLYSSLGLPGDKKRSKQKLHDLSK